MSPSELGRRGTVAAREIDAGALAGVGAADLGDVAGLGVRDFPAPSPPQFIVLSEPSPEPVDRPGPAGEAPSPADDDSGLEILEDEVDDLLDPLAIELDD
jgi:hypothetical protein